MLSVYMKNAILYIYVNAHLYCTNFHFGYLLVIFTIFSREEKIETYGTKYGRKAQRYGDSHSCLLLYHLGVALLTRKFN